ncbi:MAG TPA: hypothetical protein VHG53_06810 [Candidatus Limnocylindria bacterium]|nr:hypothetical protein [Candidatus Limnocylindria bacterium]
MTKSSIPALALTAVAVAALFSLSCSAPPPPSPTPALTGTIIRIRQIAASALLQGQPAIEIEVRSERAFPVRDELTVLRIGSREFLLSRYPESGDTHVLIFTLSVDEFAATTAGDAVVVQYGRGEQLDRWYLGRLDKTVR